MAVVTIDELERYMGACFDASDKVEAESLILAVQTSLETRLGRAIALARVTDFIRPTVGPDCVTIFFVNTPAVSVESVKADGAVQDVSTLVFSGWGYQEYGGSVGANGTVEVTYVVGFDPVPADLAHVVKRAASREMRRRLDRVQGLDRVSEEGFSADFTAAGGFFTNEELLAVNRYRRRKVSV